MLNKIDVLGNDAAAFEKELNAKGIKVFASISAITHTGTDDLMKKLLPIALDERKRRQLFDLEDKEETPILRPHEESEKMGAFRVEKTNIGLVVRGKRIEQFTKMTDFGNMGAIERFRNVIDRVGLLKAIRRAQGEAGPVYIGEIQVDMYL